MAEKDQAKVFCYIRGIVLTILSRALSFSRSCLKYLRIEFYCFLNFYEIILDLYFSEIRALYEVLQTMSKELLSKPCPTETIILKR